MKKPSQNYVGLVGLIILIYTSVNAQPTSYLPAEIGARWLYEYRSKTETVAGTPSEAVFFYNDFRETVGMDTINGISHVKIHSWSADETLPTFPTYAWYTENDSGLYESTYCFNCSTAYLDKTIDRSGPQIAFGGLRFSSLNELLANLFAGVSGQNDSIPWLDTPRVELRYPLEPGASWIWFTNPWHAEKTVLEDEWIETPAGLYETKHLSVVYDLPDSMDFQEWWTAGVGLVRREVCVYNMRTISETGDTIGVFDWSGSWELMADYFPARNMADFYPLNTGDWWQYLVEDWTINLDTSRYYDIYRVTGTTTQPNGRTYSILERERPGYAHLFRFDTATAMVMEYCGSCSNSGEWPLYYFGLEPDSSCENERHSLYQSYCLQGFEGSPIENLDVDSTQLVYSIYTAIFTDIQLRFARGIGLVQESIRGENPGILRTLVAASIAGIEYGQYVQVESSRLLPGQFTLHPAYPNPFNPSTSIRYELPHAAQVTLTIFDLLGREVTTLVEGYTQPGTHEVVWNAGGYASGIYLARLVTPGYSKTIKLVLLK